MAWALRDRKTPQIGPERVPTWLQTTEKVSYVPLGLSKPMSKALTEATGALIDAADLSGALAAVRALEQAHGCKWRAVGDREGNYGSINIGSDPGHAFVERVTNAIDAVIERESARQLRPKKGKAVIPPSPREAVQAWFGVPGGRVANLEARGKKGRPVEGPSRQELADNVVVRILEGHGRKTPTLEVRDRGIGLTARQIPRTILSLNEQNKIDKPYLAGAFGQGGSTALAFSPTGCLIVSRRQPDLLPEGEEDSIAVTFVRYNELDVTLNKNGRYEYLTLPNGEVPSIRPTKAYDFEPGSRVVHFHMEIPQYSQRLTQLTGSLWWLLQNALFDPVLPIWAEERRREMLQSKDGGKDKEKDRRTIAGNYTRLMDGTNSDSDEPPTVEHYDSVEIDLQSDGSVRVHYWVLRHRPNEKGSSIATYVDEHKPITFTFNGQSHGFEDRRFISDRLSLPHLAKSLIIQVELDNITPGARRQILSTTRDRLKATGLYQEIRERIAAVLHEDDDLDRLNRERKEHLLAKHSEADKAKMQERFAKLMERFKAGTDAKSGGKGQNNEGREETGSGGREKLPPLKTREEPTFIRVANTQKPIPVRLDRHTLIRLESDAPDNYLTSHVHARIMMTSEPDGVAVMESRTDFRGGRARLTVRPTDQAKSGKNATLTIFLLTAKNKTLATKATVRFEAPEQPENSGKGERSKLKVPAPIPVYKAQWATHGWDERSVARVDDDGRETLVFVNMDNQHFTRFLKTSSYQEVGVNRMKNNFLLYVAFYAWTKHMVDLRDEGKLEGEDFERYEMAELDRVAQTVIHSISAASRSEDEVAGD